MKEKSIFNSVKTSYRVVIFSLIFLIPFYSVFSQIKLQKKTKETTKKVLTKPMIRKGVLATKKASITLISPQNGEQSSTNNVTFRWEPIANVKSYNLKYRTGQTEGVPASAFTTISKIENNSYQLNIENGKVYIWQVYCSDSNGKLYESSLQSFTSANSHPNVVTTISPLDLEINVDTNVTLSWDAVTDPDGDLVYYTVLLDENRERVAFEEGYAQGVIVSSEQPETSYQTTDLYANTTYYWRLESRDKKGGRTRSPVWSFKTNPVVWTTPITTGSFTDTRDNKTYQTVTIGEQTWMAENLAYLPKINNESDGLFTNPVYNVLNYTGTSISEAKTSSGFQTYGVYYNIVAAKSSCPTGWHLPTDLEWKHLETYLGLPTEELEVVSSYRGKRIAGLLREIGNANWLYSNETVNNVALFNARPSGFKIYQNEWFSVGESATFWTSTGNPNPQLSLTNRVISFIYPVSVRGNIQRGSSSNTTLNCVRCVRD